MTAVEVDVRLLGTESRETKNVKFTGLCLALLASSAFCSEFPDYPKERLPAVQVLPAQGDFILDVRSSYLSGYPAITDVEIGVFELANESESIWRLPTGIPLSTRIYRCSTCTSASWSSNTRELLLTLLKNAYLVDSSGRFKELALKWPGNSLSYQSSDEFAISDDGQLVAFRVYDRDLGDHSPDWTDPYWSPQGGRLYNDLVYEKVEGSKPVTISKAANYAPPAWSPDHTRIAYSKRVEKGDRELTVLIASIADGVTSQPISIPVPYTFTPGFQASISEIRWNPTHDMLAFILHEDAEFKGRRQPRSTLFTVDADGSDLKTISFGKKDFDVFAFAWSPTGSRLALRSNYEAKTICSLNPLGFLDQGGRPCIRSQQIFICNADGSGLKRISKEPKFRRGELFWAK